MSAVGRVSLGQVAAAIERAHDVELSAYVLRSGRLERALERAGDRGAHVSVQIESRPYTSGRARSDSMQRQNLETAAALRSHGVEVGLRADPAQPLHLKAAVVDGTAYLDERNWANADTAIVRTRRPADVALVRQALHGSSGHNDVLATRKDAALALETDVIERAPSGASIRFASESFGPGPVASALEARARAGDDVRVLVDARDARAASGAPERAALARLGAAGAKIRGGERPAKECVAGNEAWAGSANATSANPRGLDWGMRTRAPTLVRALANDFEQAWQRARPMV